VLKSKSLAPGPAARGSKVKPPLTTQKEGGFTNFGGGIRKFKGEGVTTRNFGGGIGQRVSARPLFSTFYYPLSSG